MELFTGLNPYGLTYTLGLQGNEGGLGLSGFLDIVESIGARTVELHAPWLIPLGAAELAEIRARIEERSTRIVISLGPPLERLGEAVRVAAVLRAKTVRLGLTPVLCGARAAEGERWAQMLDWARGQLLEHAPVAAEQGIAFAIEDHQDLGSEELIAFCREAGPNVGICLDTGNPLAVGESPLGFAERVAPFVRHVHFKDYQAQWTDEGYRLVRCAIGDGAIPLGEMVDLLRPHHESLTASLEPGALASRHIRLFMSDWWRGYPARDARELAACLRAATVKRLEREADPRTPWEANAPAEEIIRYEHEMIRRSVENTRALGLFH